MFAKSNLGVAAKILTCSLALMVILPAGAVVPVVVWDGNADGYKFGIRSRDGDGAYGDNTYTLNLNSGNTVAADKSYVLIGPNNAQCGVTITAENTANPSVTNAFGTKGAVTVIMRCRNMPVAVEPYRAVISLMDGKKYKYGSTSNPDNGTVVGIYNNNGTSGFIWKGSFAGMTSFLPEDCKATAYGAFSGGEQTVALTYSNTGGTAYYVNGALVLSSGSLHGRELFAPCGIALGGVDVATGSQFYAMTNMQISAIAVFAETLTASEVAFYSAHGFPSDGGVILSESTNVSAINELTGTASDIHVYVPDGVKVIGDTKFAATTVHFHGDGEVAVSPLSGDTAVFDFSAVTGRPVIEYTSMPTVSGSVFTSATIPTWVTDPAQWTGTICLNGFDVANFSSNPYGNESSVVRLQNISGWLSAPGNYAFTNSVPVEIVGTLSITNGNSANNLNPKRCTVFKKISGSGTIATEETAGRVVIVIQDADDFNGSLGLDSGKFIVFGDAMPDYATVISSATVGQIFVMPGAKVTDSGFWWATGGISVSGELCATGLDKFGGGTTITTSDTGVLTLTNTSTVDEGAVDFARVRGTGTLKYEGTTWRTLSNVNFPTAMTVENNLPGGLIHKWAGAEVSIGSLAGTGLMRSDWGGGNRDLRVLQARNTTYSGLFATDDRIGTVTVAPGASSAGTLTLSGRQTASNDLVVEAGAKVNLTGTWKGTVTVYGEFGGSGTVDGDLIFYDGASIDVSSPLSVTGRILQNGQVSLVPNAGKLNGEGQNMARTLQLVDLFGQGALSEDGVTFKIDGIDVLGKTLSMTVDPAVKSGHSLSVYGKRDVSGRWRRLNVSANGSEVSVPEESFDECRFFQLRAETGEKVAGGYAVDETGAPGNAAADVVTTHLAPASTGGDVTLFSLTLAGGEESDYADSSYRTIDFELEGVASGAVATLCANGAGIASPVAVGDDGRVSFSSLPQFSDGTELSLEISSTNELGLISAEKFGERAGVVSYTWGDGSTNVVEGCVTNVLIMLANRPKADGLGGGDGGVFRIPGIAKAKDGAMVAVYDCRYTSSADLPNAIDIAGNYSCDFGRNWTTSSICVSVDNSGAKGKLFNIGDPCVLYDSAGDRFWMMGITGSGLAESHKVVTNDVGSVSTQSVADVVLYTRGTGRDDRWEEWTGGPEGNTRSVKQMILNSLAEAEGNEVIANEDAINGILQGPGHGIVQTHDVTNSVGETIMTKDTLVFPMQYFSVKRMDDTDNWYLSSWTFAAYSTDGGTTWKATKLTNVAPTQENCVMELDDGSWFMIAKGYSRQLFRTTDYKEWSCVGSISPSCWVQGSCLRIGSAADGTGRYVACFTTSTTPANRSHLTLHFGRDTTKADPGGAGVEWDCGIRDIYPDATGGMSYNSLVMLDGSTLGVVFEAYGHIYLRKVDVREVLFH